MGRAKPAPEAVWGRDLDQGYPQEGLRRAEREPIQRRETQTPPHGREREVAGKPGRTRPSSASTASRETRARRRNA